MESPLFSPDPNYPGRIFSSLVVLILSFFAWEAESLQEIFVFAGSAQYIRNVTAVSSDPAQTSIVNLGIAFYNLIWVTPSLIIRLFIVGMCFLVLVLIWAPELNALPRKIQSLRISFDEPESGKEKDL